MAKSLLTLTIVLLLNILLSKVQSQAIPDFSRCGGTTNYTEDSQYKTNLDNLLLQLKSVPSTATRGYYRTALSGVNGIEVVYGLAQCRGDVDRISCASCLNRSVEEVFLVCKGRREAAILFDFCFLRFNSSRFYGSVDVREMKISYIANMSADLETFEKQLLEVMGFTILFAAGENSRFAARIKNFSDSTDIYGEAECTRDLSTDNCGKCLTFLLQNHQQGSLAGGAHAASCKIRYAASPFISLSSLPPSLPPTSPGGSVIIISPPSPTSPTSPDSPPPASPGSTPTSPDSPPPASPRSTPTPTVPGPGEQSSTGSRSKISRNTVILIVVGVTVFLFAVLGAIIYARRKAIRKYLSTYDDQGERTEDSLQFKFDVLKAATGNFCEENKLGQGGFGPVYWGLLPDGRQIAVKRLARTSAQGLNELKNEVLLMSKLFHRNLARFLGFCFEGEEKIVVYEYLPNRSLDKLLFDPERRPQLNWETRFNLIKGIARGLLYLHDDSRLRIIHRDLKASNILLDGDMNPKISDFGLARLFPLDETHVSTSHIAGTQGYMAPEYIFHGQFSTKSDVFSFGVLVLEIVTGRRNSGPRGSVVNYVWNHWVQGTAAQAVDQSIEIKGPMAEAIRCIHVGLLCVHNEPRSRPSMSDICLTLNSFSVSLQAPSRPAFHMTDLHNQNEEDLDPLANVGSRQGTPGYEVSVTEIVPR